MTNKLILFTLCLAAVVAGACDSDPDPDDAMDADTGAAADDEAPSGTFACGQGMCDVATEICITEGGNGCVTCMPIPEPCAEDVGCGCLDAQDQTAFEFACMAQGTCTEPEPGGLVLECEPLDWGCG